MKTSLRGKATISAIRLSKNLSTNVLSTPLSPDNIKKRRQSFHKMERRLFPSPKSATITQVHNAGFRGEWIQLKESRKDYVVLYISGGGFVFDGSYAHRDLIARLVKASHTAAFSLKYSLAPEYPYPTALHEALAAYTWLLKDFEPGHIALVGDSSGGALALSLLHALLKEKLPLPSSCTVISPATDATMSHPDITLNQPKDFFIKKENLEFFVSAYFQATLLDDAIASPLHGSLKGFPPLLAHVGRNEIMYSDSARIIEKAKRAGVDAKLYAPDNMFHVWHLFGRYMPEARQAIKDIAAFINLHFTA